MSNSNPYYNIFNKFIGKIKHKSGSCFVGIFCCKINLNRNIKNIREYIETQFLNSLEKDSLYKVVVSLCLEAESSTAVKNFGEYFYITSCQHNIEFNSFTTKSQVEFNSSYLDSKICWITLQSLFKANGNEMYIVLENFMSDKFTSIKSIRPLKNKSKN